MTLQSAGQVQARTKLALLATPPVKGGQWSLGSISVPRLRCSLLIRPRAISLEPQTCRRQLISCLVS